MTPLAEAVRPPGSGASSRLYDPTRANREDPAAETLLSGGGDVSPAMQRLGRRRSAERERSVRCVGHVDRCTQQLCDSRTRAQSIYNVSASTHASIDGSLKRPDLQR